MNTYSGHSFMNQYRMLLKHVSITNIMVTTVEIITSGTTSCEDLEIRNSVLLPRIG